MVGESYRMAGIEPRLVIHTRQVPYLLYYVYGPQLLSSCEGHLGKDRVVCLMFHGEIEKIWKFSIFAI